MPEVKTYSDISSYCFKKNLFKRPTCFFQKMSDQTNLWPQEKKNQKVFSAFFLLINSSKIGVENKVKRRKKSRVRPWRPERRS